jgi:hypothetical protein
LAESIANSKVVVSRAHSAEAAQAGEPSNSAEAAQAGEPGNSAEAAQAGEPGNSAEAAQAGEPSYSAEAAEVTQSSYAAQPVPIFGRLTNALDRTIGASNAERRGMPYVFTRSTVPPIVASEMRLTRTELELNPLIWGLLLVTRN